jgi:hypothetical protein
MSALPRGTFRLTVSARTAHHRRYTASHRYRGC